MYIADLHIHSKYSRATSRDGDLPHLDYWARRKGIALVGTGDFTHPAWRQELEERLAPAEDGYYTLKEGFRLPLSIAGETPPPRFVVTGEISNIYKKNGRTRKVHNLILLPSLEAADTLSRRLEAIGNIHSDGRPILGLDSRDLLEITLEACPEAIFIPAHIWTPHFSMFGAFSGFDTVEECYGDLTPYIHGVETGLSSDPPMNWRLSALDRFTLLSNSDAHSPQKLGREGNLLTCPLTYPALSKAIETGEGFAGTLEFFPEEGKYHLDGHRSCGLCLTPQETIAYGGKCPVCGKKITIGVEHRVEELADRPAGFLPQGRKPFESLAPVDEVIAASTGASLGVKTQRLCDRLVEELGPEFAILREIPISDIEQAAGPCVAEGIRRMRLGQVERSAGYDGEYGSISLLSPEEIECISGQVSLFGAPEAALIRKKKPAPQVKYPKVLPPAQEAPRPLAQGLNPQQQEAVESLDPAVAVVAGPGTGKTKTLVARVVHLIREEGVKPQEITAVTFTNQAAAEMRQRLEQELGGKRAVKGLTIGTFHAICRGMLGEVRLLTEEDSLALGEQLLADLGRKGSPQKLVRQVSQLKNGCPSDLEKDVFDEYCRRQQATGLLDFDDLLRRALEEDFGGNPAFHHLLVDEFQDCNDLQYQLVRQWSQGGKSLFVIGDPDQSIYGFRGAQGRCFDRLREDLPQLRTIRLTENYRSTPEILSCALSAIAPNPGEGRVLHPNREGGPRVRLVEADSEMAEGIFLAKEISRMAGGVDMVESDQAAARSEYHPFSEIAVLCRTHHQLDLLEKCLRHDSIPCLIYGREDYLCDPQVRGLISFFRWMKDPGDTTMLEQALSKLWDCPADLISRVQGVFNSCKAIDLDSLKEAFSGFGHLELWLRAVEDTLPHFCREKPRKLFERLLGGEKPSRPVEKLLHAASFHSTMPSLLDALLLGREGDLCRASGKAYAPGAVRLMTLHGAKGLEFPVVFLCGVKTGMLPLESPQHPTDPEEERRLFFVGITRAREELILTTSPEPSPFLNGLRELDREHAGPKRSANMEQLTLF